MCAKDFLAFVMVWMCFGPLGLALAWNGSAADDGLDGVDAEAHSQNMQCRYENETRVPPLYYGALWASRGTRALRMMR